MTYKNGYSDSDSVNLGSNPSPPANENARVSGVSRNPSPPENPERTEQTAHTGRTEVGTLAALRARGHPDLATNLWQAMRYPYSAVLRGIIGRGVERMGGAG